MHNLQAQLECFSMRNVRIDSAGLHQSTLQHVCMPEACGLDTVLQAECNMAMGIMFLHSA